MTSNKVENDLLTPGISISNRWIVIKRIGGGGFGEIYNCFDKLSGISVAIKVESQKAPKQILRLEVPIIRNLQTSSFVCRFYAFGTTPTYSYLVMSLQGKNLYDLRKAQKNNIFSISTTLRLSISVLKAIEDLHKAGYVHRDIKPSNFAIGRTKLTQYTVYMFDFGLTRRYKKVSHCGDSKSIKSSGFRGTIRYASANVHRNGEIGRNDDLWSAFYMFAEMKIGKLPWTKLFKRESIGKVKQEYDYSKLLRYLPREYGQLFSYIRDLKGSDDPDYKYMRRLLYVSLERYNIKLNDPYDWEISENSKSGETQIQTVIQQKVQDVELPKVIDVVEGNKTNVKKELTCYSGQELKNKALPPIKSNNSRIIKQSDMGISKLQPVNVRRYSAIDFKNIGNKVNTSWHIVKAVPQTYYSRYATHSKLKGKNTGKLKRKNFVNEKPEHIISTNKYLSQNSNSLVMHPPMNSNIKIHWRRDSRLIRNPYIEIATATVNKECSQCSHRVEKEETNFEWADLVRNESIRFSLSPIKSVKDKKIKNEKKSQYSMDNLVSITNRISSFLQSHTDTEYQRGSSKDDILMLHKYSENCVNNLGDVPNTNVSCSEIVDYKYLNSLNNDIDSASFIHNDNTTNSMPRIRSLTGNNPLIKYSDLNINKSSDTIRNKISRRFSSSNVLWKNLGNP